MIVEVEEDVDDRELDEENNNHNNSSSGNVTMQGPMYTIMSNAQKGETLHKKYIKEMQRLYEQVRSSILIPKHVNNLLLFCEDGP